MNQLIVSPKLYEAFNQDNIAINPDIYCTENDFYYVDENGDVHYFRYRGKNLAGVKE